MQVSRVDNRELEGPSLTAPPSSRVAGDNLAALVARVLVCAMPVLLLTGKAPPDIALSIVALLFLLRSALVNDWSWVRTPWVAFAMCLCLYLIVVSFAADDARSALGRAAPWVRFLVFGAALQTWVLADEVWRARLLVCTGLVLAFVVADMFFQFIFSQDIFGFPTYSDNRLTGPMPELPPKVGVYVLRLMFPVLLALLFWAAAERRHVAAKIAAVAAVCAAITAILISGERMPFILALLGFAIAVLLLPARRIVIAAVLAAGLSVATVAALSENVFSRSIESTMSTIERFGRSHYGQIWLSSVRVAEANPLFGVGLKNFRLVCTDPAYGQTDNVSARCSMHPHNMYLEWLAESGLVGLAGFLCLIGLWTRHFVAGARYWRREAAAVGLVVAVTTFLWPIASTMSFFTNWHAALFWFVLGWALAATDAAPSSRAPAAAS